MGSGSLHFRRFETGDMRFETLESGVKRQDNDQQTGGWKREKECGGKSQDDRKQAIEYTRRYNELPCKI